MKQDLDTILEAEKQYQTSLNEVKAQRSVLMDRARIEADLEIEKLWNAFEENKTVISDSMESTLEAQQKEIYQLHEEKRNQLRQSFEENKKTAIDALIKGVFVYGDS